MKNRLFFLPLFFVLFSFGCATSQIKTPAQMSVQSRENERLIIRERVFYALDEPLFRFYSLVRQYEKKLNEYLVSIKEEKEFERSSLVGLRECFLMEEKKFQAKWKEIDNNPETAAEETEKFLHEVNRAIIALESSLQTLENILKDIKSLPKQWVLLPYSPLRQQWP